jgi:hypothetical protein
MIEENKRQILQKKFGELLDHWDADGPLMEVTVFFKKDDDVEAARAITLSITADIVDLDEVPRGRMETT